jgi:hypothetical protein
MAWNPQALVYPEHQEPGPFKSFPQTYGSTATVVNGQSVRIVAVEALRPVVMQASLLATGAGSWSITEGSGRAALTWTLAATPGTRQSVSVSGETVQISFVATASGKVTGVIASYV